MLSNESYANLLYWSMVFREKFLPVSSLKENEFVI